MARKKRPHKTSPKTPSRTKRRRGKKASRARAVHRAELTGLGLIAVGVFLAAVLWLGFSGGPVGDLVQGGVGIAAYLAPVVSASHRTLLRPLMGKDTGLKYHRGQCIYEKGYYTFVGPTVATGMRRKIEMGLLSLTGRRFRALARRGAIAEAKQKSSAELPT